MRDYRKQLLEGGYKALLVKLHVLEKDEDYEACIAIRDAINEHNEVATKKIPNRLKKEEIYQYK